MRKKQQAQRRRGRVGHMRVPPIPPPIVTRPWFPLTVRMEVTSQGVNLPVSVVASDIGAALATQLFGMNPPPSASFPVQARLQSVRVWGPIPNLSTSTIQPLTVVIMDLLGLSLVGSTVTSPRALDQITRYPDVVRRATIGYRYPDAQSNLSLDIRGGPQALATPILSILSAGPTILQNTVVYWTLLWRSGVTTAGG